jgi:hypothetical protein
LVPWKSLFIASMTTSSMETPNTCQVWWLTNTNVYCKISWETSNWGLKGNYGSCSCILFLLTMIYQVHAVQNGMLMNRINTCERK